MNILLVANVRPTRGGVSSYINTLASALRTAGHPTVIMSVFGVTETFAELSPRVIHGIDKVLANDFTSMASYLATQAILAHRLASALSRCAYDIVNCQDVSSANAAFRAGVSLAAPLILTVHGPLSREARMLIGREGPYFRLLQRQEKQAYDFASCLIAVDKGQKDLIVENYGVAAQKIHVIHNAVGIEKFAPEWDLPLESSSRPIFLVPRRLVPKNGVSVAIDAIAKVPEAELWIAGDGPEREQLIARVHRLGIAARVKFMGSVPYDDMPSLMGTSTGIIVPSVPVDGVEEATSLAAIEAMSCGRPVIASRLGGLAAIIRSGVTGLLFSPGSSDELAAAMRTLLASPSLRDSLGAAARKHVVQNLGSQSWVEQVMNVYIEAIATKSGV